MKTTMPPVDVVYAILGALAASGGNMEYVDLLNTLPHYANLNHYLRVVTAKNYVIGDLSAGSRLRLTPKGWTELYERSKLLEQRALEQADKIDRENKERRAEAVRLKERREDHAREDRQNRTQNHLGYFNAVIATLGFLLGILAEYRFEIVSFCISLARN